MKTEEQEYIKRILGGEMELYGYFLDTYGHRIFALVQQMVPNREDAEDITQDIFVKAYESLKRYRGDCEFITWIYRIACNVTSSILRKTNNGKSISPSMGIYPNISRTTSRGFLSI